MMLRRDHQPPIHPSESSKLRQARPQARGSKRSLRFLQAALKGTAIETSKFRNTTKSISQLGIVPEGRYARLAPRWKSV